MKISVAIASAKGLVLDRKIDQALRKAMDTAIKAAGFEEEFSIQTKSGVYVQYIDHAGAGYDHSVPISKRGPDRRAPVYYSLIFEVGTSGESQRHTVDGPMDVDKNYFTYKHRFDGMPTPAEIKAVLPELKKKVAEGHKVFLNLLNKHNAKK